MVSRLDMLGDLDRMELGVDGPEEPEVKLGEDEDGKVSAAHGSDEWW